MIESVSMKGGDCVLQETIKAVKEAEAKAEEIVKTAEEKAEAMEQKASQDAELLKKRESGEAREKASEAMNAEKVKAASQEASFDAETAKEIAALKQVAAEKESQAIQMVISELF